MPGIELVVLQSILKMSAQNNSRQSKLSMLKLRIGIVGLGLIGGSLGRDLRAKGHDILGISQRASTCETAIAMGAVDTASADLASLATAEVIFICTPIGLIVPTIAQLVPHIPPTTILTDVGSVKATIVEQATQLWPNFIGGHPMAGTAESGIQAAQQNLFVGNPYVLTPIASTPRRAIERLEGLIADLGAALFYCLPAQHDRAVAWISHLPVMTSASLIAACLGAEPEVLALAQALASSGFRDTSRVGGGNPELGVMMAEYNREALLPSLYQYRQHLDQMIATIEQQDWPTLSATLEQTQAKRSQFLR
jgi:arogenate dehydrogenase (NADP+)